MKKYIREKKIYCGSPPRYLEVDIIPYSDVQATATRRTPRQKKSKETLPAVRDLNDRHAIRYLTQLINANFDDNDISLTLTYTKGNLPESVAEAEKNVRNYIRRLRSLRTRKGLPPLKYIVITEYGDWPEDGRRVRIHHHLILSGGVSRDEAEDVWRRRKQAGERKGAKIGRANADRLQPEHGSCEALARYLLKNPKGKKKWTCSQNLSRPWVRNNDSRWSRRKLERICKEPPDAEYWERQFPGYRLLPEGFAPRFNPITGQWSLYLKFRRIRQ